MYLFLRRQDLERALRRECWTGMKWMATVDTFLVTKASYSLRVDSTLQKGSYGPPDGRNVQLRFLNPPFGRTLNRMDRKCTWPIKSQDLSPVTCFPQQRSPFPNSSVSTEVFLWGTFLIETTGWASRCPVCQQESVTLQLRTDRCILN